MRRLVQLLAIALIPGAAAGAAAGALFGWRFLAAGFPWVTLDAARRGAVAAVVGTASFVALFAVLELALARLAGRGATGRWVLPSAAALAGAPFVVLAGLQLNRAWGIRPSAILEPYALGRNLALLAACLVLYAASCAVLSRQRSMKPLRRPWLPIVLAGAAVAALHLGVAGAGADRDATRPDVLVLLVDALRADHLSSYGHSRPTTPAIDGLAADGVLFRQAIAQSTFTKSSIASLFTGRYAYQHGLYWGNLRTESGEIISDLLRQEETTLAEALRAAGYLTAAWVQNSHLTRAMGFDQGFLDYRDNQGGIARIHRRLRPWLEGPGRRYPTFAYVHYIDLHDPYRPAAPYDAMFAEPGAPDVYAGIDLRNWGTYLKAVRDGEVTLSGDDVAQLKALYDGQLRAVDDEIAGLLAHLKRLGLYDDTLIVLTSDHGDGFMEHGFISHSTTPYEELVRVPLIVKLPQGRSAGRVVERQVRLIDVMPTVLEAAGLDAAAAGGPEIAGCSLLPLLAGGAPDELAPDCGRAVIEIAEQGAYPIVAVRAGGFKYIHHQYRRDELYDLRRDPGESDNLIAGFDQQAAGEAAEVAGRLREIALAVVAQRPQGSDRLELDEQTIRELKALGYIDD